MQLEASWVRDLAKQHGAADVGFVSIDRPEVQDQRADITSLLPRARTLISFVCSMNPDPIRAPHRSVANLEFHQTHDETNGVARALVRALGERGHRATNPSLGFPMEMDRFPGKVWVVSHKPIAVAAGLGKMGIHRNVIHPKLGSFILLGTVITDAELSEESRPIDFNPCVECKLCVAACPTGAIKPDGAFDFSACYTHNYREFMGGFTDWVENVVESKNAPEYRARVSDSESASMWQSLSYGANYKAAYCLAVCPAGSDVIPLYQKSKPEFLREVVDPLVEKKETIYVRAGSDAEEYVARRFPQKTVKKVGSGLRPKSVDSFLTSLSLVFQRGRAKDLEARYRFTFTGEERAVAVIAVDRGKLTVTRDELESKVDLEVSVDGRWWLAFLRRERRLWAGLLLRKLRLRGDPRLLLAFSRCFAAG